MRNTVVISAFPGTGKTHAFENIKDLKILDSDSSKFSWIEEGKRDPAFPQNYIDHIKENIGKVDVIMVSSHKEIREALQDNGIFYTMIYPDLDLRDEYMDRFITRGDTENFRAFIYEHWHKFIGDIKEESPTICELIKLEKGEYISDIIEYLVKHNTREMIDAGIPVQEKEDVPTCVQPDLNEEAKEEPIEEQSDTSVYEYQLTEAKQTYSKAFSIKIGENDNRFLIVNQERFNPINFGINYHKDGYDGFACFWYNDGRWNFSLYNDNGEVDCSVICKAFGGSGNKDEAGMVVDTNIMKMIINNR